MGVPAVRRVLRHQIDRHSKGRDMKVTKRTRWFGAAAMVAGMLLMGTATAWYGGPWYRSHGAGAVTYERQNMMRDHGHAMEDLSRMFQGRRSFDREEAIRLAKELEEGFGTPLLKNFAPGAVVAGSRTAPWTWRNFGAFEGYSKAASQSAARLVQALENESDDAASSDQTIWVPGGMRVVGPLGFGRDGPMPLGAVQEHGRLNATCNACHFYFRGARW